MESKNKTYLAIFGMLFSLIGSYLAYYYYDNPFLAAMFILILIGALYVFWEELHRARIQE